ncbi:hypothetical protein D3C85_1009890 [compost metagenome]
MELDRIIEEEIEVLAQDPVGRGEQFLIVADGSDVVQRQVGGPFGRLREGIAVDVGALGGADGDDRIEHGAVHHRSAEGHQQVLVLDLGVVPGEAAGQAEAGAQIDVAVHFHALAHALVGVDQLVEVAFAADGGELRVGDLVIVGRGVQTGAAVPQASLEAGLIGHDGLRVGGRDDVRGGDAALDRRAAVAVGHASEQVEAVVDFIEGADVPADLLVADRLGHVQQGNGRLDALTVEVAAVVGVAHARRQLQGLSHLITALTEDRPGIRLLHDVGHVGRDQAADAVKRGRDQVEAFVPVECADLPAERTVAVRRQAQFIGVLDQVAGQGAGL